MNTYVLQLSGAGSVTDNISCVLCCCVLGCVQLLGWWSDDYVAVTFLPLFGNMTLDKKSINIPELQFSHIFSNDNNISFLELTVIIMYVKYLAWHCSDKCCLVMVEKGQEWSSGSLVFTLALLLLIMFSGIYVLGHRCGAKLDNIESSTLDSFAWLLFSGAY